MRDYFMQGSDKADSRLQSCTYVNNARSAERQCTGPLCRSEVIEVDSAEEGEEISVWASKVARGKSQAPRVYPQYGREELPREKLFACTYCGKVFNRPKKVVIHQRIHTGEKPFKCNTCGKFFAEAGNLRKHQKVHTGERPYSCSQCGQTFAFPGLSNVVAHQRVHTGERPFKCDTCGKLFTEAGNLKKHQRVHTGEKPFICPRCGKRFAWICNLKTHQQVVGSSPTLGASVL
uniref:C2H2-type domain-containing protein n=1 Tax=Cyprinus carpio TaxID=7962 RepID=A0A8C2Q1T5_CYPCA